MPIDDVETLISGAANTSKVEKKKSRETRRVKRNFIWKNDDYPEYIDTWGKKQTFSSLHTFLFPISFYTMKTLDTILLMRIWFFWTPSLSAKALQDLLDTTDCEVVFVVTNPDKPIGRNQDMTQTPVKTLALSHQIPVFTPWKIRENTEFFDTLRTFWCDYYIVVAYGKILPKEVLQMPKKMCINIHGSILPAYRWASPIQSALLHGEETTGVTIMEMSEGMDEGDILKIREIEIAKEETTESLFEKFMKISGPTLIQTLRELETWGITPLPQDASRATYCKKIEKEDGLIDWNQSAKEIYQKWQAYTPWPGIYTIYEGKRLLLEKISLVLSEEDSKNTGKVIKQSDWSIGVICGKWILTLEQVKLEWKKSQNIKDFVNGNQNFIWITL
jgi:methionyl-tRNA formyltransferase